MSEPVRELVIDTSGFFSKSSKLMALKENGSIQLSTIDLVILEFIKVMEVEINRAMSSKKADRVVILNAIRERFPKLIRELDIKIKSPEFLYEDILDLYSHVDKGLDPADSMIWLKMQRAGLDSVATRNVSDWKKLGAKVIAL
ncbi:MAG: hypothetical protein ACHQ1H_12910 [Nitrososphaerales archaeon]